MKNMKKIVRELVNFYKSTNESYIPIYNGDELLTFGKVIR